jgi:hypothetical protein
MYLDWEGVSATKCLLLFVSDGLAVMSVDLGSEYMKIAIVKVTSVTDNAFSYFNFQWIDLATILI